MARKRFIIFLLIFSIILSLYGCNDKKEIEEQAFVSAIGLDEGKNNNVSITFQMVNANYGRTAGKAGGGGGDEPKTEIVTFDAPDIISARDLANISVARRITLSHAKIIVVSEKLAKEDKFFQIIESPLREKELRRGIDLIISKEKAADFIRSNDPKLESHVNKFYDFMTQRWKETGLVPVSTLNKFMQRVEEGKGLFIAVYGTTKKDFIKEENGYEANYKPGEVDIIGGNPTQLIGSAVFKSGKMVGSLTGQETRIISLLRRKPDTKTMIFTIPDPIKKEYRITIRVVKHEKTKVNIDLSKYNPTITVKVPLIIEVLSIPSFTNYVQDFKLQRILKEQIKDFFTHEAEVLVRKTKDQFGAEPFLWELEARKKFSTYPEYKAYNWPDKYSASDVKINFDIEIKRFGKQLAPPEEMSKEDDIQ
ncbi:Ger(x)C family spore germination protein [Clostridium fungisolvens]|uniref:Spore germination protein B3 n=1 Tax=Clostridium fungisolvens TaxID=1604897 RepID=A0A6V8SIQ1_9CLOT|nr:Ger(x)C family spore germination protein [Clostridium fungisolvens]GFP74763.1 Spore germination protein B3 [Clostridium fungisolvens]